MMRFLVSVKFRALGKFLIHLTHLSAAPGHPADWHHTGSEQTGICMTDAKMSKYVTESSATQRQCCETLLSVGSVPRTLIAARCTSPQLQRSRWAPGGQKTFFFTKFTVFPDDPKGNEEEFTFFTTQSSGLIFSPHVLRDLKFLGQLRLEHPNLQDLFLPQEGWRITEAFKKRKETSSLRRNLSLTNAVLLHPARAICISMIKA